MRMHLPLAALVFFAVTGCAARDPVPVAAPGATPEPTLVLVWVGRGEAERLEKGAWVRVPEFDYDFSVEQRRWPDRWESVKSLRRRHPAYDGSAGPRAQTYFFTVTYGAARPNGEVPMHIESTLGAGDGVTDVEFRRTRLELRADVSSMAPFDRYRLAQTYAYEAGALEETVALDDGDRPWVRNHERARLFATRSWDGPPTRR